jgi:putative membrane protein
MILAALTAALIAPVVGAQQAKTEVKTPRAPVDDILFAAAAADCGEAAVTLAELGFQKATDPKLKSFSRRMIDDYGQAGKTLRALFAAQNINLPTAIDPRLQFRLQSLAGLSGAEFDRAYAKTQYLLHEDIVDIYAAESLRGDNPELKAFATKFLPTLKEHYKTTLSSFTKADPAQPHADK